MSSLLSKLPSVDKIIGMPKGENLVADFGRQMVVQAVRTTLNGIREDYLEDKKEIPDLDGILSKVEEILETWMKPSLVPVINATGVIIHTNLGRAPLPQSAIQAVKEIGGSYSSLEFDLGSGARGSRLIHAESLFQQLLGVEAALVVNNNASAVLLVLTALTRGKKVVISRSQLVEIGGGFRIPDVLRHSGTELSEVGTTNKTRLSDYEAAYNQDTAAVMRAHTSNYSIVGFTSEPDLKAIVDSAHQAGLLFIDDLGSGAMLETDPYGLKHEPTVQESLAAGADLVCFSGDKLLGGPQAGIILGRKELIDKIKIHPLARAIRADKMALAALNATLGHYLKGEALEKIPVWQMIAASESEIKKRANSWKKKLKMGEVIQAQSMVGGGSLPGETLPSWVLALDLDHPQEILASLRESTPVVIGRIENDRILFDPRTVLPDQDQELLKSLKGVMESE